MTGPDAGTGFDPPHRPGPRALLRRLREIMSEETAPQARLNAVVKSIAANLVGDVCSIYVRRTDEMLELFATEGLSSEAVHVTRLSIDEGLVGWVARRRLPLQVQDAKSHEAFSYREETGEDALNGFLGVPVIRSGQVLGVLVVQNKSRRVYTDDEIETVQTVATILAEVVASGELLEEQDREAVEQILHQPEYARGSGIVGGIVEGIVVRREPLGRPHPTFATDVAAEKRRLEDAIASVQKSVDDMIAVDRDLSGTTREVLEVFRLFAYDKGWARRMIEKVVSGLSAESAVEQIRAENRQKMRGVADPYLRERFHDLEDLTRRLLRELTGEQAPEADDLPDGAVLLAESLGPAEFLEYHSSRLKGLVLGEGASTSHAAIVARSFGVPMVSGVPEIVDKAAPGETILLDGATGEVHLRPPQSVIDAFADRARLRSATLARYRAVRDAPAVTRDGVTIELQLNAGLIHDLTHLDETGAGSVGLFRTELQFLLGRKLPTVSAQEAFYRQAFDAAGNRPIMFRTADIGSDKRAGYMSGPREANPAMGWRGLRMALDRAGLLRTQIRALLAAARGRHVHLMFPMVATQAEFSAARAIVDKELERHAKRVGPPPAVSLGAMVEVPSAAWCIRQIAEDADFLSIGGNDLAQFFFAADRECPAVSDRYDPLCPAFLSFLRRTVREARAAGRGVGYCGEQAGDPVMALALIAIGVERLSVAASAIGPLKAMVRSLTFSAVRDRVNTLIDGADPDMRGALSGWAADEAVEIGGDRAARDLG